MRKLREAKDRRGKLEGDVRPFRRITSSLLILRSREDWEARRASRACLIDTVLTRYEDVSWSCHD